MSWVGYLMLGLTALMVGYILWTGLTADNMTGKPVDPLYPVLPGLADQRAQAVIYCFSRHCPPCRKMAPDIDRLQANHPNVFKLNISEHHKEARAIGIRATPTTLLVENGNVLKVLLGTGAVPAIEVFLSSSG